MCVSPQAIDESNTARLAEIRHQWTTLLSEVESRNRQKLAALAQHQDKLDAYEQAVIDVSVIARTHSPCLLDRASFKVLANLRCIGPTSAWQPLYGAMLHT